MAHRTGAPGSSGPAAGVRVTVARGQTRETSRLFVAGDAEQVVTIGAQGDWRIAAPGVVGAHLRLAFDGRRLFAAAAQGSVLRGNQALGAEWSALAEGDELRFGFALLRIGGDGSTEAAPLPPPRRSVRRPLAWALGALGISSAAFVLLLVANRAPPEPATNAVAASTASSPPPALSLQPAREEPALAPGDAAQTAPLELLPTSPEPGLPLTSQEAFSPAPQGDPSPPAPPPVAFAQNIANRPVPRIGSQPWLISEEWRAHHDRLLRAGGRSSAKVIFLGDSITEGWSSAAAYKEYFGKYSPINLGIASDTTQNVLWRIRHGALDGTGPLVVVTLVGINNLAGGFSPQATADGLRAVVTAIQDKLPNAKVLLLGVLPARQDASNPLRKSVRQCNELLHALARPARVEVLDVGSVLLEPDGSISKATLRDYLHPTPAGYEKLSRSVAPKLAELAGY